MIKHLDIDYFNPGVEDWTPEGMDEEMRQRESCDFVLYVITPLKAGTYSIAEAVDDSNKRPDKTIFCVLEYDSIDGDVRLFNKFQLKTLNAISKMIEKNGGKSFDALVDVANYLNTKR